MCGLEAVIRSMSVHSYNAELHCVCLLAIENMCKADVVRGNNIQNVCDSIRRSMKLHNDNKEIISAGSHVLTIIGTGHTADRRRSVGSLQPVMPVIKRKSVTEELLGVATAALQKLRTFTDDVLECDHGDSEEDAETEAKHFFHIRFDRKSV